MEILKNVPKPLFSISSTKTRFSRNLKKINRFLLDVFVSKQTRLLVDYQSGDWLQLLYFHKTVILICYNYRKSFKIILALSILRINATPSLKLNNKKNGEKSQQQFM